MPAEQPSLLSSELRESTNSEQFTLCHRWQELIKVSVHSRGVLS